MSVLQLCLFLDAHRCDLVGCNIADPARTLASQEEAVGCKMRCVVGSVWLAHYLLPCISA